MAKSTTAEDEVEASEEKSGDDLQDQNSMQSDEDGRVRVFELESQEMAKSTTAEDEVEAWYRVEYQTRGKPHCHALYWLWDDAFLDKAITE